VKIGRKGEDPIAARLRLAKQEGWKAICLLLQLAGMTEREARQAIASMKRLKDRGGDR
jgi:hypothetical protein